MSSESSDTPSPAVSVISGTPRGVGGWLALLCLGLLIGAPLSWFRDFSEAYTALATACRQQPDFLQRYPRVFILAGVHSALSLALAIYSVYAGIGLIRVRPAAVRAAKRYFVLLVIYEWAGISSYLLAGTSAESTAQMISSQVADASVVSVYAAIWFLYLCRSKRVRTTYGAKTDAA
jgi:hypothetical protein